VTSTKFKIWVEAPVIGRFVAKVFSIDTWESSEKRVAREIKKVREELRHKHPRVNVWVERIE
jgi:hypothetical protein